jgi:hypothetical protein
LLGRCRGGGGSQDTTVQSSNDIGCGLIKVVAPVSLIETLGGVTGMGYDLALCVDDYSKVVHW